MNMIYSSDYGVIRVLVIAPLAYIALVVMLRISGKRTLSKMNMFDWVVTVALGSMLASTIISKSTALVEGVLGMGALILLQFIITWLSVRSDRVSELVKGEPTLLYHRGEFLQSQMKRSRVTESEVQAAAREQGNGALEQVDAVVLETDGTFSVITSMPKDQNLPIGVPARSNDA